MTMQAAEQFLQKVAADAQLQSGLMAAFTGKAGADVGAAAAEIARQHGFDASGEELERARLQRAGEVDDAELEGVAGGFRWQPESGRMPNGDPIPPRDPNHVAGW